MNAYVQFIKKSPLNMFYFTSPKSDTKDSLWANVQHNLSRCDLTSWSVYVLYRCCR